MLKYGRYLAERQLLTITIIDKIDGLAWWCHDTDKVLLALCEWIVPYANACPDKLLKIQLCCRSFEKAWRLCDPIVMVEWKDQTMGRNFISSCYQFRNDDMVNFGTVYFLHNQLSSVKYVRRALIVHTVTGLPPGYLNDIKCHWYIFITEHH